MKKLWMMAMAAILAAGTGIPAAQAANQDAVLLVLPARYSVVQVAFDVARRYPSVLVSYQGTDPAPQLHVWTGYEWLPLGADDYQSGAFLQSYPSRTLFLGGDDLLPASLRTVQSWCPESAQFPRLATADLINDIGQYLPFTPADWRWFAGRYNLSLENANAGKQSEMDQESFYSGNAPVKDEAPGFFKYFTRSRRNSAKTQAPYIPVERETVDVGE